MHRERASLSIGNTKAISRLGSCSGLLVLFRMIYSVQDSQHLLDCLQAVTLDLDAQSQHFLLLSGLTLRDLADKQPLAINYKALMQSFDVKGIISKK